MGKDQAEILLQVQNLCYRVGGKTILQSVTLEVKEGEFVGIIGPNGAGKTTLLRLILGILKPSRGEVKVLGTPLDRLKARERAGRIAYLSQEQVLASAFPVFDVVLLGRYPYLGKFKSRSVRDVEMVQRALSYVGLKGFEQRYFNELSGGERQLVLFARILVQETDLLLLDEPSSNLDLKHEDKLFSMAAELCREKKAVLVSVHNLNIASLYCSRLILLDQGRIAAAGKPDQVLKPEILDRVYATRTSVSANTATGSLNVSVANVVSMASRLRQSSGLKIHIIGGAGNAVNLTRELYRLGYSVTGGIAHDHDTDAKLWQSLDISHYLVDAFTSISIKDVDRAASLVEDADLTLLTVFPIGAANLQNLELARRAGKLVIVTPGPGEVKRDFFVERARKLFEELAAEAIKMSYDGLIAGLERGAIPAESATKK